MYIAYSERTIDVDGAKVTIGNESWNYRTDRGPQSRRKKYSDHVFVAQDGSDFSAIGSHSDVMEAMREYLKTASPLQR